MGKRGPKRTPEKVLAMRGSPRAKLAPESPESQPGRPQLPHGFTKSEKVVWAWLCEQLEYMDILTKADRNAMTRYCFIWCQWQKAAKEMRDQELNIPRLDRDGRNIGVMRNPLIGTHLQLSTELRKLDAAFGLTPGDRASIRVPDRPKTRDKKAKRTDYFRTG